MNPFDSKNWVRCPSDQKALDSGKYQFNLMRGTYTVFWIERYCTLYEGEKLGSPLRLVSYHPEEPNWWDSVPTHNGEPAFLSEVPTEQQAEDWGIPILELLDLYHKSLEWAETRARWHIQRVQNNDHTDWQYEGVMQVFGWETYSEKHQRHVRRFRSGSYWVSKKNKKSPTLAAIGLYLLDGDGEPGAKVYLAAADGGQAKRIAGAHTLAMVEQSKYLAKRSKINLNEGSVAVKATRSKLEPLSSNNARTISAKEGLNGSALIDETHVVDGRFMATIDRMGISRSEPLLLEFSTAGDNPDGYGFKRWKYGETNNESGEDPTHYHLSYHVPQDLNGPKLAKDPLKYGRMANAAWGHTVDPDEWLADYHKSKVTPAKLHDFLKYRCNQWQRTTANFISEENWKKCEDPGLAYGAFKNGGGGIGLDLSRTDDFSVAVICQTIGDDRVHFWPIIWVPETKVEQLSASVPEVLEWAESQHIKVMEGATVNRDIIRSDLVDIIEHTKIKTLCADNTYANELMEFLENKCNITAVDFPQYPASYSAPTDDLERMTIDGNAMHPVNPAYDWQIYNTHIKEINGHRKPIKDPLQPERKIDATQATVMAIKADQLAPQKRELSYRHRGVIVA